MRKSGADAAVEAVCAALELIPVPIVGKAVGAAIRSLLNRGEPIDEVLSLLQTMAGSDADFARGLEQLTGSLEGVAADVSLIRQILIDQQAAAVDFVRGEFSDRWPAFDNQITGILTNPGGGSVVVEEVRLVVEGWEPNTTVDLNIQSDHASSFDLMWSRRLERRSDSRAMATGPG